MMSSKNICIRTSLEDIAPFPAPTDDQIRYVIRVPAESDEKNLKVDLQATKNAMADRINNYWYEGSLEAKTVEGLEWDYTYYVLYVSDSPWHTLMAGRPSDMMKTLQPVIVSLGCDEKLLSYDSKVPIVIYTPKDVTLNYVIWHADNVIQDASEG